jgi:signal transduction histidine kinase/ActR/RegA family two-component response regulator
MIDRETIKLVAALSEATERNDAAAALAARTGAAALFLFVEDEEVDALLPAPGLPQTICGGPEWRAFLREARAPGLHPGTVAYPSAEEIAPAVACAGSGVTLVFVGADCNPLEIETVCLLLPLIGSTFRAEHAVAAAKGELNVAREDARNAGALAKALDTARADLERQAKSLVEARGRAEEAMRAKDEFLAMLGHELRNPLAPMITALQILRMKGIVSREHEILERQVTQQIRLVDDLLDVSRIARGKVELRKERFELATVAERAVEIASPLLERKRQLLTVDIAPEGLPIEGDSDRLAQVFSNLLTNAAKYSDEKTRVTFTAERKDSSAIIRVKDEGFGIEAHMLDAIFETFTQQPQSMDRSAGGLGLGLAIVRNLVSLHGGTVVARSEGRGKGSEFIVALPLSLATAPNIQPADSVVAPVASTACSERVLIVDDNEDAAEMLSAALTEFGYVVLTASDGPSALVAAEEFLPQIALLDIGLPVMDGYELCQRMRSAHSSRSSTSLRVVALTGYGQASDKARSRDAGFDAHLVKPVDLRELQRLLDGFSRGSHPPSERH